VHGRGGDVHDCNLHKPHIWSETDRPEFYEEFPHPEIVSNNGKWWRGLCCQQIPPPGRYATRLQNFVKMPEGFLSSDLFVGD
jgi:hypothetical protein